jgi:hypothetical protein
MILPLAFTWRGRGVGCVGRAGASPASGPAGVSAQLLHHLQGEINRRGSHVNVVVKHLNGKRSSEAVKKSFQVGAGGGGAKGISVIGLVVKHQWLGVYNIYRHFCDDYIL